MQASYHTNQVNVLIHVFCVPTILFTALILTHGIPGASKSLATIPLNLFGQHIDLDVTIPFLWAAANAAYFVLLEPVAGVRSAFLKLSRARQSGPPDPVADPMTVRQALYAPILLTFGHLSNVLYSTHHDEAMRIAGYAFVASWIAQFVGHGKVGSGFLLAEGSSSPPALCVRFAASMLEELSTRCHSTDPRSIHSSSVR